MSPDERLAKLEARVARFPDSEVPRYGYAEALFEVGRYAEAAREAIRATELRADFVMGWLLAARSLHADDRSAEARPFAERARALSIEQRHSQPRQEAEELLESL